MAKKDGMYFYYDWIAPFEKLNKNELADLVLAMLRYAKNGEEPPRFEGFCGLAADFIFPQINRSQEYAKLGKRGGYAKRDNYYGGAESFEDDETEYFEEKTAAEQVPEKEVAEESGEKSENTRERSEKLSPEERMFRKMQLEDKFTKFWREYPKKAEKQRAFEVFKKLDPDRELMETILSAVKNQKNTQRWQKDNGQYIPYPANWLEGRRWEDETEQSPPKSSDGGSFDTDDFFELAVRRTYGDKFRSDKLSD